MARHSRQVHNELDGRGVRLAVADVMAGVRAELDRYGVTDAIGSDAFFSSVTDAVAAFRSAATE